MKLAASNIAWPATDDAAVADLLIERGIAAIEVAPTKVWPNPLGATGAEIDDCRKWWADRGIRIVAAQALLFGRPDLTIFENAETRRRTRDYLAEIIRLCARLGAEALVFGSPKNRKVGALPATEVAAIAADFFGDLGECARAAGTHLVMEANPAVYGADYVTRARDALELVEALNHPGFRLHLDTACMALAGDEAWAVVAAGKGLLRHFHASEPDLDPVRPTGRIDHTAFAELLRLHGYGHWVSLEMRQPNPFSITELAASLRYFRDIYGPE